MSLAIYQDAAGKTREALNTSAEAIMLGDNETGLEKFNTWLTKVAPDSNSRDILKKEIAKNTVSNYLNAVEGNKTSAKSTAAAFYSAMILNLDTAEAWAFKAVKSINKNTTIEDQITFHKNLALVYAAEGKSKNALKELKKVENYVDPWDSGFWLT